PRPVVGVRTRAPVRSARWLTVVLPTRRRLTRRGAVVQPAGKAMGIVSIEDVIQALMEPTGT
ncbi:MAG: hypothetical protein AAGD35_16455, partial [Actinomycetota bacterium]